MKFKKVLHIFITAVMAVVFIGLSGFSKNDDDPVIVKIIARLNNWLSERPTEKVYLQLDKPYYAAGDNIWFKAYITGNNLHQLSTLSGLLNVELIDTRDSITKHIKLPVTSGIAWGDFALPDTLPQGNYRIRAYTNWMCNAGPDYYFDKTIAIGNVQSLKSANGTPQVSSGPMGRPDVQFFPESGNLVNGLRSKVAVKLLGNNGLGVEASGTIVDDQNNTVTTFATRHLGMGVFALTPQSGKNYKAIVDYPDGSRVMINIPAALNNGYILTINNTDTSTVNIKVVASAGMANAGQFYIVAQAGGEALHIANNKTSGNVFSASVAKSKFPSGIVQFTLFSPSGQPLNERIIFIQHDADILKLNVVNKSPAIVRGKTLINLDAVTNTGKPIMGNFSVAVIDESKVPDNKPWQTNILSNLLLTSDLRGYVENPGYYFDRSNANAQADLDILMLTQGYRRFEWKPLLDETLNPPLFAIEKGIDISGTVTANNKTPLPGAKVSLFSSSGGLFYTDTVTDSRGRFAFKDLILSEGTHFLVDSRSPTNKKNVIVNIDNNDFNYNEPVNKILMPWYNNAALVGYLGYTKKLYDQEIKYSTGNHNILLKEVDVYGKRKKSELTYSSNISGAGNANQVFTSKMLYAYGPGNLEDFLRTRLNGVRFVGGFPISSRTTVMGGLDPKSYSMLVLINGVESYNNLADLMTSDVGSVEILRGSNHAALYGPRALNGVIIINLKNAMDVFNNMPKPYIPNQAKYSPKGYYAARVFYSPQYDEPKVNKALADLRSTIYWNPNVMTNEKGQAVFEYYNAGTSGTYKIIIEGIDGDGRLGRAVYRYQVGTEL